MANVTKFPTSAQEMPGINVSWSNINNIKADDGSVASITLGSSDQSKVLLAGDFNFGISPLATIDGLVISMERYASLSNSIQDVTIRLTAYNGAYVLSDNQSTSAYWSTTNGVVTFGSPSDLWDRTDGISVNILNNLEFFLVCVNNNYSSATGYVDYVKATVYYSIDGVKFSTSSLADIRDGSTQIQKIYHGSNQVFPDDDPNSISWSNVSGASPVISSTQTFTGLNTSIPIRLSRSAGSGTLSYVLNGGSPVTISNIITSQYANIVSISNNDTLSFRLVNTGKSITTTVSVYHANKLNGTDTYELLAQFTMQNT